MTRRRVTLAVLAVLLVLPLCMFLIIALIDLALQLLCYVVETCL